MRLYYSRTHSRIAVLLYCTWYPHFATTVPARTGSYQERYCSIAITTLYDGSQP